MFLLPFLFCLIHSIHSFYLRQMSIQSIFVNFNSDAFSFSFSLAQFFWGRKKEQINKKNIALLLVKNGYNLYQNLLNVSVPVFLLHKNLYIFICALQLISIQLFNLDTSSINVQKLMYELDAIRFESCLQFIVCCSHELPFISEFKCNLQHVIYDLKPFSVSLTCTGSNNIFLAEYVAGVFFLFFLIFSRHSSFQLCTFSTYIQFILLKSVLVKREVGVVFSSSSFFCSLSYHFIIILLLSSIQTLVRCVAVSQHLNSQQYTFQHLQIFHDGCFLPFDTHSTYPKTHTYKKT